MSLEIHLGLHILFCWVSTENWQAWLWEHSEQNQVARWSGSTHSSTQHSVGRSRRVFESLMPDLSVQWVPCLKKGRKINCLGVSIQGKFYPAWNLLHFSFLGLFIQLRIHGFLKFSLQLTNCGHIAISYHQVDQPIWAHWIHFNPFVSNVCLLQPH